MTTYLANGNPIVAVVLMSLSMFKGSDLTGSFQSVSLSFTSEESAKKFVEDVRSLSCTRSGIDNKLNNVVVVPDYAYGGHAAKAIYHAVNSYKDQLISIGKFVINPFSEEGENLLKDIEQYIEEYFGADAVRHLYS